MSCLDFSMVPGGAFIMCESISEYDANMMSPAAVETAEVESSDNREAQINHTVTHLSQYPYIQSVIFNYRKAYEDVVKPLINMPVDISTDQDTINMTHIVSKTMEHVIGVNGQNHRMLEAAISSFTTPYVDADLESVIKNFLKNKVAIIRDGYDNFTVTSKNHPLFSDIEGRIRSFVTHPELLDEYDLFSTLDGLSSAYATKMDDYFSSISDMYQTVLYNVERFDRQFTHFNSSKSMQDFVNYFMNRDIRPVCYDKYNNRVISEFTEMSAKVCRCVKQKMYDIQTSMLEGEEQYPDAIIRKKVMKAISCVNNIFAIGLMLSLWKAIDIDNICDKHTATEEYVDTIKSKYPA